MIYLSPVWHSLSPDMRLNVGYMQNLYKGGVREAMRQGFPWMLDNGAFSDKWTEQKWLSVLEECSPHVGTCIAAVCPDVMGNAAATVALFDKYEPVIRRHGYKVAFVTQDGLQMDQVPWGRFEVLFVGGTNQHKLKESWPFIYRAKELGLWVHIGRVNSFKRIVMYWMADSWTPPSIRRASLGLFVEQDWQLR